MSRKRKHQERKSISVWIMLGAGGLLLLIAGVLLAGRNSGGTPVIGVDQEVIDYGDVKLDTPLTFSIAITNTGNGVLRFKEDPYIEIAEGC